MQKIKEKLWESKELIVAIFLVLLLLITGSYAWYKYNLSSDKVHIIKAGNLKLVLDDSMSEGILIRNAIPVSDRKGLESEVYTFTLENLGTTETDYTLYFDDLALGEQEKRMRDDYIKYSLIKNEGSPTTAVLSTIGENPNRVLETGTIAGKTKNSYTLRVWINKDAENDVMGTVFYGKIRIVAESKGSSQSPTNNENIEKAVSYDTTTCPTGEEATCVPTKCFLSNTADSCLPGTIIKYKVNDATSEYFYVLHDDGETLTLQQRDNTVYNITFSINHTTNQGPDSILPALESATADWSNVNTLDYKLGETVFMTNAYTGCIATNCTTNVYTMDPRKAKARMITIQELNLLGCSNSTRSCPSWIYDFLQDTEHSDSHTENGATTNRGYWTMSGMENYIYDAWAINTSGAIVNSAASFIDYGARAVIQINK